MFVVLDLGPIRILDEMFRWRNDHIGRKSYAAHGGSRGPSGECIAIYFRQPASALEFVEQLPMLGEHRKH